MSLNKVGMMTRVNEYHVVKGDGSGEKEVVGLVTRIVRGNSVAHRAVKVEAGVDCALVALLVIVGDQFFSDGAGAAQAGRARGMSPLVSMY